MILKKVQIENFLSVTESIEFDLDQKITILLGANDHGKSNILKALLCLNDNMPIQTGDANWDATEDPSVSYLFQLSTQEVQALHTAAKQDAYEQMGTNAEAKETFKEDQAAIAEKFLADTGHKGQADGAMVEFRRHT